MIVASKQGGGGVGHLLQIPQIGPREWIIVGGIATVILIFFAIPLLRWFTATIGQAAAAPFVQLHDLSQIAHLQQFGEIRQALHLADQSIANLQRQLDVSERNQRDRLDAVQSQLKMAIDLLERG